jgi:hypothetical protein
MNKRFIMLNTITGVVHLLFLLLTLLAQTSNAFCRQRPFLATRTRGFARLLWQVKKEDDDPKAPSFSDYTMKSNDKGPSDNAARRETTKEESDPPSFVMQNLQVKGPLENAHATAKEVTLNESTTEEREPDSGNANESINEIDMAVFEATESEQQHGDNESNNGVTIAEEVEQVNATLSAVKNAQGDDDLVDVEDAQEADETSSVVAKAGVELGKDTIPILPQSKVVDAAANIEVDCDQGHGTVTTKEEVELTNTVLGDDDLLVDVEDKNEVYETSSVVSKAKVKLGKDAIPFPESAMVDATANIKVDSDQDPGTVTFAEEVELTTNLQENASIDVDVKQDADETTSSVVAEAKAEFVQDAIDAAVNPEVDSGEALLATSAAAAKDALEDDPKLSVDSASMEKDSSLLEQEKDMLKDSLFDFAGDKGTLEEDPTVSLDSKDEKEAETAPVVEMKDMPTSAIKTNDKLDDSIVRAIETLEDAPESPFDSPQDELEMDSFPIVDMKSTSEDLLIDSEDKADAQRKPAVKEIPEHAPEVPFKVKDESETEATALVEKVEASESTMPVVVLENETPEDEEQPAKERAELKEETGKEAGFFFGKSMSTLDESTVMQRIKQRKEAGAESEANKR